MFFCNILNKSKPLRDIMSMSQKNTIYHACFFFTEFHKRYYLCGGKFKKKKEFIMDVFFLMES